jgi:tetratricopeptide (TPR) repeat protein
LSAERFEQAEKLAGISLELQPNQSEALKILTEAQLQLAKYADAAGAGRNLRRFYPAVALEVGQYAEHLASVKFAAQHYREAADLAAQAADLEPEAWGPLVIQAKAGFALAEFSSAADAYGRAIQRDPVDPDLRRSYADALAASHPTLQTAQSFEALLASVPAVASLVRVDGAGLRLLAGDGRVAQGMLAETDSLPPESVGRLGWWYYRAGRYSEAAALLRRAADQRPGDAEIQAAFGWNLLAQHQADDALRHFPETVGLRWNAPLMGRAIAEWQSRHATDALKDFDTVAKARPEWLNPQWVATLFPPEVQQSAAGLQAEWHSHHEKPQ